MQNILSAFSKISRLLSGPSSITQPSFIPLTTIRPQYEGLRNWKPPLYGRAIFDGSSGQHLQFLGVYMPNALEFTLTGCIDCNVVKALPKDEPKVDASFEYGSKAVCMWKDPDNKHHLIIVSTKPERMFLSCQPFDKLLTTDGVSEILNFVANIPKTSEVEQVL